MNGEIFQGECVHCKKPGEVQDMSDMGVESPICFPCWMEDDPNIPPHALPTDNKEHYG